jgi:hypothetical protein
MSDLETMGTHRNRWVYWVAVGLLVVFVVIGLASYRGARATQTANDKADELLAVLAEAGVDPLPSREQVVGVLGDDGGAACADPADALAQATLQAQLTNGATGPGQRPVVADSRLVRAQLAVMSVYCPDQLEAVQAYLDGLQTDDVVRG